MKHIIVENNVSSSSVSRNIEDLENLCQFSGERLTKMGQLTIEEGLKLGVGLIVKGEDTKARGIFVLASQIYSLIGQPAKDLCEAIKMEFIQAAIDKTVDLLPKLSAQGEEPKMVIDGEWKRISDAEHKRLASNHAKALEAARQEGAKRFDNLGQTLRAAHFIMKNPTKVADSTSVFTVQQANAYLEAPKAAKDGTVDPVKLAVHKAVAPLLKAGASQAKIKEAVKKAKDASAPTPPADNRTEAQKKEAAQTNMARNLCSKASTLLADWDALTALGMPTAEIRRLSINAADESKGSLAQKIAELAKLAGFDVSPMKTK